MVVDKPGMRIPDPDIRSRPFIAVPLLECDPDLTLPDTGEKVASLPSAEDRSSLEPQGEFTKHLRKSAALEEQKPP
jgi:7,8-dihydro-6-hydroxymethylpterin-pyrophosphokinase